MQPSTWLNKQEETASKPRVLKKKSTLRTDRTNRDTFDGDLIRFFQSIGEARQCGSGADNKHFSAGLLQTVRRDAGARGREFQRGAWTAKIRGVCIAAL